MSDQENEGIQFSKADLLKQIEAAHAELEETIGTLDDERLSRPGATGWAVKDHLAHLATWELGMAELLQRRDRFGAMQIQEAIDQRKSEEEVNALIYQHNTGLSAAEAKAKFADAHRRLLEALEPLSDDDLRKPYAAYLPEGSQGPSKPVWHWIVGNSSGHFEEHTGYIRDLLQER